LTPFHIYDTILASYFKNTSTHLFVPYYPFGNCGDSMEKTNICPVGATLDLIGGKYKALILWHLAESKLRFSQLNKQIPGATAKMLTQQLREMEAQNLIHREVYPVVPPKVEYSLTELGRSLMPVLIAMRDWGSEYLQAKNIKSTCFMMNKTPL